VGAVVGRRYGQEALVRLDGIRAAGGLLVATRSARGSVHQQHEQEHEGSERGGQQERVALGAQHRE